MFPPSTMTTTLVEDLWGEMFQDLTSWYEPLQDTTSTMVGDIRGSSCIVRDSELNTPETATGSKNTDSATSMFPPSTLNTTLDEDLWGEMFQDLTSCYEPLKDTTSTVVADIRGSSCIVRDSELNTPERGVQREFNLTSPPSVLREESLPYLSDWEGWEIPQMASVEDKSVVTLKKAANDNTQSKPANEFFVDGTLGLSVTHEEEIMSSHNLEGLNLEGFVVNEESDNMKTTVNTYELEHTVKCMDFGSRESASKASLGALNKPGTVENTNVRIGSLESLWGPYFDVRPVNNGIFSVNQQQVEPNLSLKSLLSSSIYHSNINVGVEIRGAVQTHNRVGRLTNDVLNTIILEKSQGDTPLKADIYLLSQTMESNKTFRENGETETSLNMQEPNPGICKQAETVVPAEIFANRLSSLKQMFPSASKEKSSTTSRSKGRKSSSSISDDPPSKKSRMPCVDPASDRYRELRVKNNEASRKSRKKRKARESEMKEAAVKLEAENRCLKIKVEELEQLVKVTEAMFEAISETTKPVFEMFKT